MELVNDAVLVPESMKPELAWLVTDAAKNGFQFGQLLGQVDDLKLWPVMVVAWIEAGEQRPIGIWLRGVGAGRYFGTGCL